MPETGTKTIQSQEVSTTHSITILHQKGNYADSMKIASQNGGRLAPLKEFITQLKDDAFYQQAKGAWYWLDGKGLDLVGHCRIDYDKGTLNKVTKEAWDSLPIRERAYAWKGSGPLALGVLYVRDGRLGVGADFGPLNVAPRVAFVGLGEATQKFVQLASLVRKEVPEIIMALELIMADPKILEKLKHLERVASEQE